MAPNSGESGNFEIIKHASVHNYNGHDDMQSDSSSLAYSTEDSEEASPRARVQGMEKIASSLCNLASAMVDVAENMGGGCSMNRMKTLVEELKKIPDLTTPQFLKACILLAKEKNLGAMFLVMGKDMKRKWLLWNLERV
ncbi:uncharacterized protein LOC131240177 [Magnolia sinica]|uniref:uncharacterized protein LOC131240177 n=1 Tax=Magnolia sinica TaxID=86752 RepID=UPI00265892A0|nr:uncharacterized protein LOC131240177 [Magnolia sinica]XP_058094253.1 uncharacterized protein LOC131240177 [Magnolia sinica]XP_058094254.1 uncharacterized protein LOC131240177 [Magnolia sinica]